MSIFSQGSIKKTSVARKVKQGEKDKGKRAPRGKNRSRYIRF